MSRIAIMQPYFFPYAGYFRLMCDVDAFVLLTSVQFPREGWVHRNRLTDDLGRLRWWTLPIAKMPLATTIAEIRYGTRAQEFLRHGARKFEACRNPRPHTAALVEKALSGVADTPAATIESLLVETSILLGIAVPVVRDTELKFPSGLAAQERVLAICEAMGADRYVNSPGGSALYEPEEFARRGIKLELLPPYRGDPSSILQRLHDSSAMDVRAEILANLH